MIVLDATARGMAMRHHGKATTRFDAAKEGVISLVQSLTWYDYVAFVSVGTTSATRYRNIFTQCTKCR